MKKQLAAISAAAVIGVAPVALEAVPAQAATPQFCHYSPDDGLDSAIEIIVSNGNHVFVAEGRCSTYYTSLNPIGIHTPAHQEIWCKYSGGWHRAFYGGADGNTNTLFSVFDDGSGCTKRVGS